MSSTNFGNSLTPLQSGSGVVVPVNGNTVIGGTGFGNTYKVTGAFTVTLPYSSVGPTAGTITIINDTSASNVLVVVQGADSIRLKGAGVNTLTIGPGDVLVVETTGTGYILVSTSILKANLSSPSLVGIPTAPTANINTNTSQVASTAFVIAQASDSNPLSVGLVQPGSSTTFSRSDHIHPSTALTQLSSDNSNNIATTSFVKSTLSQAVPAGTVIYYASNAAPTGYLKCNGAILNRTTYSSLFSAIGVTFGAGDGSSTFVIPDLRGEFLRGWDDSRGLDTGRSFGTTQTGTMQSHYHNMQAGGTGAGSIWATGDTGGSTNSTPQLVSDGTENRPHNIALLACIKY